MSVVSVGCVQMSVTESRYDKETITICDHILGQEVLDYSLAHDMLSNTSLVQEILEHNIYLSSNHWKNVKHNCMCSSSKYPCANYK